MGTGVNGVSGQAVQQRVELERGRELENATTPELRERGNIALMMEVGVMKWKNVIVDTVAQLIKVKLESSKSIIWAWNKV